MAKRKEGLLDFLSKEMKDEIIQKAIERKRKLLEEVAQLDAIIGGDEPVLRPDSFSIPGKTKKKKQLKERKRSKPKYDPIIPRGKAYDVLQEIYHIKNEPLTSREFGDAILAKYNMTLRKGKRQSSFYSGVSALLTNADGRLFFMKKKEPGFDAKYELINK